MDESTFVTVSMVTVNKWLTTYFAEVTQFDLAFFSAI